MEPIPCAVTSMSTPGHVRVIESDDGEFTYSCTCQTVYQSRLNSWADAAAADQVHKAAVRDGSWQAAQDAHASDLATLAPLHDAIRAHDEAATAYASAGFAILVAQQHGGDVPAARGERARLALVVAATAADIEALR